MKHIYTYIAEAPDERRRYFICHALNKRQMRCARMNMRLKWERYRSYQEALEEIKRSHGEIVRGKNVSNVQY